MQVFMWCLTRLRLKEMLGDVTQQFFKRKCSEVSYSILCRTHIQYSTHTENTKKTNPHSSIHCYEVRGQALQYWGDHSALSWYSAQAKYSLRLKCYNHPYVLTILLTWLCVCTTNMLEITIVTDTLYLTQVRNDE